MTADAGWGFVSRYPPNEIGQYQCSFQEEHSPPYVSALLYHKEADNYPAISEAGSVHTVCCANPCTQIQFNTINNLLFSFISFLIVQMQFTYPS